MKLAMKRRRKKTHGKGKLYKTKTQANRAKDRQAGSNVIRKVKGGWKVYRA